MPKKVIDYSVSPSMLTLFVVNRKGNINYTRKDVEYTNSLTNVGYYTIYIVNRIDCT